MITQYTRLLVDAGGAIIHCTAQTFPFADGWQPIEDTATATTAIDLEIDADYPDQDFKSGAGIKQLMIRGRQIIENFEVVAGIPKLKTLADSGVASKVLRISAPKSIEESDIKTELASYIDAELIATGSSEKTYLDLLRSRVSDTPEALRDLKTIQLVRIKKALILAK